jgi:BirA family biotin operon repressor/biotin-[acetyl-CoA-carboxylase] ligase
MAEQQALGRGRRGRTWHSPPGGLYLSVLLERPAGIAGEQLGVIALLAGVAVVRALGEWGVRARLKWPNDVRVEGRKIAGILVETLQGRESLIVGVGVNVNGGANGTSSELGPEATSLSALLGRELSVEEVARAVLGQLALCHEGLGGSGPAAVVEEWRRHAEDWWGRRVDVRVGGQVLRAALLGIAASGALLVEDAGGARRELLSGDIEGLRLSDRVEHHDRG